MGLWISDYLAQCLGVSNLDIKLLGSNPLDTISLFTVSKFSLLLADGCKDGCKLIGSSIKF